MNELKLTVRTALLLALMTALQSLRLFMPVPPLVSLFVIGSLLNAVLLIALLHLNRRAALIVAVFSPIVAYLQQALPLPLFILPVALTNCIYVLAYEYGLRYNRWAGLGAAALLRPLSLYLGSSLVFQLAALPHLQAAALQAAMSWGQLFTAAAGVILTWLLSPRLLSK